MAKTSIEWVDYSWNPATGCTHVSAGCDHCYADRLAQRLMRMSVPGYEQGFTYTEHESRLRLPYTWKRPRRIFVNSMSDLFHEHATFRFVDEVFTTMLLNARHTYHVLTKRPGKMRSWVSRICDKHGLDVLPSHILLGTSVENQTVAKVRIPQLMETRASVRYRSCEPLLGPVDLTPWMGDCDHPCPEYLNGEDCYCTRIPRLHWVITGAESGPGARPMDEDWVRGLRDACVPAGVAFFYKQNAVNGRKVILPALDGKVWTEFPDQERDLTLTSVVEEEA